MISPLHIIMFFLIMVIIYISVTSKETFWTYSYRSLYNPYYNSFYDSIYNPFGYSYYNWTYPNPNYISTVQYATVQPHIQYF